MTKVLVVDDEISIRKLMRKVLERSGFEVADACDGFEAIGMLAADDYDVVLLDVMMPKVDGFGVIDSMRARQPDLLERTLLVTAAHLNRLHNLPVRGVLTKPFNIDELLREVAACVEQPAPA